MRPITLHISSHERFTARRSGFLSGFLALLYDLLSEGIDGALTCVHGGLIADELFDFGDNTLGLVTDLTVCPKQDQRRADMVRLHPFFEIFQGVVDVGNGWMDLRQIYFGWIFL